MAFLGWLDVQIDVSAGAFYFMPSIHPGQKWCTGGKLRKPLQCLLSVISWTGCTVCRRKVFQTFWVVFSEDRCAWGVLWRPQFLEVSSSSNNLQCYHSAHSQNITYWQLREVDLRHDWEWLRYFLWPMVTNGLFQLYCQAFVRTMYSRNVKFRSYRAISVKCCDSCLSYCKVLGNSIRWIRLSPNLIGCESTTSSSPENLASNADLSSWWTGVQQRLTCFDWNRLVQKQEALCSYRPQLTCMLRTVDRKMRARLESIGLAYVRFFLFPERYLDSPAAAFLVLGNLLRDLVTYWPGCQ